MSLEALQHEESFVIPQHEDVTSASSVDENSLEQTYLDQRRLEARSLIQAQGNLLREYKEQIKSRIDHETTTEGVLAVIDELERKGDFVSAELFREVLLENKIIEFPQVTTAPQLTEQEIQQRREEAKKNVRLYKQDNFEVFEFHKEIAINALKKGNPEKFIQDLENKGDFYRAEIAREAFIEAGLLQDEHEVSQKEYLQQAENYILTCNEDPRRMINRLFHQGRIEEAHVVAKLLEKPEVQRKIADIEVGRGIIKDIRANCEVVDYLENQPKDDDDRKQLEAIKLVIADQLKMLTNGINKGKFTLTQIGSRQMEIDAIEDRTK